MTDARRPWRGVSDDLFQFTTTSLKDLHIALMTAFEQAAILTPAMNFDQVRVAMADSGWDEPIEDEALHQALSSLTRWGLLDSAQDLAAHYATAEEFERRNLQWSLTRKGEAATAGVMRALEVMQSAVGLQTAVLNAIGDALVDLAELSQSAQTTENHERLHIRLSELESHMRSLIDSIRQFQGHLQRLIREDANDDALFHEVKRSTMTYLQDYVDNVDRPVARVTLHLNAIAPQLQQTLFQRALIGANLAPLIDADPAPAWLSEREQRWRALQLWFAPTDGAERAIDQLLGIARSAIIQLLRAIEQRFEARRRSTSIASDFRTLAHWFDDCPGDADAHRLFAAAFGMWPSRHAHKPSPDGAAVQRNVSWLGSEPVMVEPALRTSGTLTERGRDARIRSPDSYRADRQRLQAEKLARRQAIHKNLHTSGLVKLSTFATLEQDSFAELLNLLFTALVSVASADGKRRALSSDARVEIIIETSFEPESVAVISAPHGTLSAPDLSISIMVDGDNALLKAAASKNASLSDNITSTQIIDTQATDNINTDTITSDTQASDNRPTPHE